MAQTANVLHLTNGDAALYLLDKSGVLGTHVAWKDPLYDGPVPSGLSLEATSELRAPYLAGRGYGNPIKVIREFEQRDGTLRRAASFSEIVLWFEHDLFDQLEMLQILTALEELNLEPGRICIVQTDDYLANMTVDEILRILPKRRSATPAIFKSARRNWIRFTSSSTGELFAAANEETIGLPYLRAALRRLCEEYPSARDGLSRSQRQALHSVVQGPAGADELFARSQAREEASFLGNRAFVAMLSEMRSSDGALLEGDDKTIGLTALGRRVVAGDTDWLADHRIDRWIGGVHLEPGNLPRWDDEAACFV